ncbi:DUF5906 domain-containing protein [Roseisalinus antarcticus]|uniref:Uncharacterized protein n=1 Tax=Roseisalinus antarcticus TaxID=254357 RepID=A0A1Y5TXU7_9RHOB|nr:DUF5906 domain-containing protein [Roseisalinus antarcticus]SLN76521.1 hypothetical protein ROA7023_04197 [Roseisalinus antarcticus]
MNIVEQIVALADKQAHTEGFFDRKKGKYAYRKVEGPITLDKIAKHLDGSQPLGMYMTDNGKSPCLVFDFDDHDKEGIAIAPTITVARALDALGVPHLIFRSGGGHGYHIWMFFEQAMSQDALWKASKDILALVDEDHARYVPVASGKLNQKKLDARGKLSHIEHGVEVLPKGDENQNVAIPCSRASVPMRLVSSGSIVSLEECSLDDLTLEFVPVASAEVAPADMGAANEDAAFDCYIKNFDVNDYAKWGGAGIGLVAAFGKGPRADWAHERWLEWTKTSDKYRRGDEDQWKAFKPKKYSPLSFWRIATRHGYKGPWPGKKASAGDISDFNEEWALMNVNGKVEFLNTTSGDVSNTDSFYLLTKPDEGVRNRWLSSPRRRQFNGYTFAAPEYEGDKWNLFRGWPVEPTNGDASLFEKYVVEMLCYGDQELAHWVMTFIADAIQQPWSPRPGAGLALRGPQGSGKSFLGKCVKAALGNLALEVTNSDRVTQQFNDMLVGKTALLCEEAFFTGSPQQQLMLKNLITADDWTFEPKNRKTFTTPNIFRIIATTNNSQAVAIDNDDRRWTIIESKPACPHSPTSRASYEWWAPYYSLIRDDPGAVLRYLLDYKVDKALISFPYLTDAKGEDKITSDPLLQVLVHMVETGTCPDDLRGDGRVASAAVYEAVKERGGRWLTSQSLANDLRKRFGAQTARNCIKVKRIEWRPDGNGVITPIITKRTDRDGLQMPPLGELRAMVSAVTGQAHEGPEAWIAYEPDTAVHLAADPNGGDADDLEQYLERQIVMDQGKVVEADIPF